MARRRDVEIYGENPFIGQLSEMKTRRKRVTVKSDKAILDTKTGELEDVAEVVAVHHVDSDQFVKVFTSNLRTFFNLRPSTYKILEVLLHQIGRTPQQGSVYLNMSVTEEYFQQTDQKVISRPTFHACVKEMIQKGFIAESPIPSMYWINPALFFNGDRVRFVKEYRNLGAKQGKLALSDEARLGIPQAIEHD